MRSAAGTWMNNQLFSFVSNFAGFTVLTSLIPQMLTLNCMHCMKSHNDRKPSYLCTHFVLWYPHNTLIVLMFTGNDISAWVISLEAVSSTRTQIASLYGLLHVNAYTLIRLCVFYTDMGVTQHFLDFIHLWIHSLHSVHGVIRVMHRKKEKIQPRWNSTG